MITTGAVACKRATVVISGGGCPATVKVWSPSRRECLQSLSVTPMGEVSVDASPMVAMSVTGGGRVAVLSGLKPSDQHVSMMTVDLSGKRSEKSQTEVGEEGNGGGGGGGGGGYFESCYQSWYLGGGGGGGGRGTGTPAGGYRGYGNGASGQSGQRGYTSAAGNKGNGGNNQSSGGHGGQGGTIATSGQQGQAGWKRGGWPHQPADYQYSNLGSGGAGGSNGSAQGSAGSATSGNTSQIS